MTERRSVVATLLTSSALAALAVAALTPFACSGDAASQPTQGPAPGPNVGPTPTPPTPTAPNGDVHLFKRSRPMMGTIYEITVAGETDAHAAPAVQAALAEIQRLETILSEWRNDSEISRVNAGAGNGQPVHVGPDTLAVVKAGIDVSRWSDGAFDLSWAALRGLYTFQPDNHHVPTDRELRTRVRLIGWRDIVLDEAASTIMLRRAGMAIGTGGIAKGYALDRASEILERAGMQSFMLFGGGQVQVHGLRGDRAWRVGIQHPRTNDYVAFLEASEGSISTSGDYEHFFIDGRGRRWHHIIDPRTGRPVPHTASVSVLAPRGLYADALSTAVFVLGAQRGIAMLATLPFHAEAVVISADGTMHYSPGTRERLRWHLDVQNDRISMQ